MSTQPRLLIVQSVVKRYRVAFYDQLRERMRAEGITLRIAHGPPGPAGGPSEDECALDPDIGAQVPNHWLWRKRLLYQPVFREAMAADLVVVEQATKHLVNYPLLALSMLGVGRLAFWGHGYDRQGTASKWSERVKRTLIPMADWWFAYTEGTAEYVRQHGMPNERITVVGNTTDVEGLQHDIQTLPSEEVRRLRHQLGIPEGTVTGLFCGSLHDGKMLPLLLAAARRVHQRHPSFRLVISGAGPLATMAQGWADTYPWIRYIGRVDGLDKALLFRIAQIFLVPAALGLALVDAFAAGIPVVTSDSGTHGPEIDYLRHHYNGVLTACDEQCYAEAVAELVQDVSYRERLASGARESASSLTAAAMAHRFTAGVLRCLACPRHR